MKVVCTCYDNVSIELNMLGEENLPELGRATGDREQIGYSRSRPGILLAGSGGCLFWLCVLRKKGVRKGGIDSLAKVGC
jgi:hypothetical protein